MTYWKTEHFKALQNKWYQRLEAEGFQDVEEVICGEHLLRQCNIMRLRTPDGGTEIMRRQVKELYYTLIAQRVEESEFKREVDKIILVLHATGSLILEIRDELTKRGMPRHRNTITNTIQRYEIKWGLRKKTHLKKAI